MNSQAIKQFQRKVLDFYQKNKRSLPWRSTRDPYKILVSEIMLQQTQVERVVPFYQKWIKKWPTVKNLAAAQRVDVLKQWMGLGYNNRAINLHKSAKIMRDDCNGDVLEGLKKKLPGIGPYTARAVEIFSQNSNLVTVDTNIRRIFIHEFDLSSPSNKELWLLAERCLPQGRSRDWHNALMDYGSLFLTSQKTGIPPKTKQSRFEGSDRQIRARMVRKLLKRAATFSELQTLARTDPSRLKKILTGLVKDDLVTVKKGKYSLAE